MPVFKMKILSDWMKVDSNDPGYQLLSDDGIAEHATQPDETAEEDNEDNESKEGHDTIPSCGEVKDMLDRR